MLPVAAASGQSEGYTGDYVKHADMLMLIIGGILLNLFVNFIRQDDLVYICTSFCRTMTRGLSRCTFFVCVRAWGLFVRAAALPWHCFRSCLLLLFVLWALLFRAVRSFRLCRSPAGPSGLRGKSNKKKQQKKV